jgi:putative redox protein
MAKRITVRWEHRELDFTGTSEEGASVTMAGPDVPEAFRPAGLVLAALAGCTGMDAISIMQKKRVPVESYEVRATGTQRDEHPRSFSFIVVEHIISGSAIDDRAVRRAIDLSAGKYCVVGANLATGDCEINHRMRITDERGERTCDCLVIGPRGKGLSHYGEAGGATTS